MPILNVLYQSDNNYAAFMGVSICSLLESNKSANNIHVYIIDDSISKENKDKLVSMVHSYAREIFFLDGKQILNCQEITAAFTYSGMRRNTHSYLKLFADRLLPALQERIVYIDCDTAVIGDLSELLSIDMKDKPIGMAMDSLMPAHKAPAETAKSGKYYNSGVMLIDLNTWRKSRCSERILQYRQNGKAYGTVDQDILNAVLSNEILTLPARYNLQPVHIDYSYQEYSKVFRHQKPYYTQSEIEQASKRPTIIHYLRYIGESPWHADTVHPGAKYFDYYLQLSPWKDYCKKKSGRGVIFRIEKWMYLHLPKSIFLRIFHIVHEAVIKKSNHTSPTSNWERKK